MKTGVTLTFDNQTLKNVKQRIAGKSLSTFTNDLFIEWLQRREREELIADYKEIASNKVYKELANLVDITVGDTDHAIKEYERAARR